MNDQKTGKVNCFRCVHFAVTWEVKAPKACKLFGFKSSVMPSVMVFKSTGSECLGYVEKNDGKPHTGKP